MKKKQERNFVNPFSESFMPNWEWWKIYKKEEFRFAYKSSITEQAAINHLVELSAGNEQVAAAIIKQSIENGWKGLFELKNPINGKSNTSQATRQSVNDELAKRFAGRG